MTGQCDPVYLDILAVHDSLGLAIFSENFSTVRQHRRQGVSLIRGDGQAPVALDLDPGLGIGAVERR